MDDLISRQAAIEALRRSEALTRAFGYHNVIDTIRELPSVHPELNEWCHDCKEYDTEKGRCPRWGQVIRTALEEARPEQRWIPVSDRLPEESGRYLISVLDGIARRTTVAKYQSRYKAWTMTGRMAYWQVIAWMPLPEPYGGEE